MARMCLNKLLFLEVCLTIMRWLVHLKSTEREREREMGRLITAKKLPAFCSATAQPGTAVKPVKNSSRWGSRLSRDAASCQGTVGEENGAACPAACDHNEEENSHSCIQINVTTTMCFCPTFFSPLSYYSKPPFPFPSISSIASIELLGTVASQV